MWRTAGLFLGCLALVFSHLGGVESERVKRGIAGFDPIGDAVVRTLNSSDGMISCGAANTTITLTSELLSNSPISPIGSFDFLDASPSGSPPNCSFPGTAGDIVLDQFFGQCASSVEESGNLLVVNYTLCVSPVDDPAAVISRDVSSLIYFTCTFVRNVTISDLRIDPLIDRIRAQAPGAQGEFVVDVTRFSNSAFNETDPSQEVTVEDPVYVGLGVRGGESADLVLQALNCWATPTSNSSDVERYDIIVDSCEANTNSWEHNMMITNYAGPYVEFKFNSFVWTSRIDGLQEIYPHCEVTVCPNAIAEFQCLVSPCTGSRKRRGFSNQLRRQTISLGSVKVPTKKECDKECSHDCTHDDEGIPYCTCPPDMTLDTTGVICLDNSDSHLNEVMPDVYFIVQQQKSNPFPTLLIAALLMTIIVLGMMWLQEKRRLMVNSDKSAEVNMKI